MGLLSLVKFYMPLNCINTQPCKKKVFFSIFRLCDDYEEIAEKALTTPANTEQLMELKAYIEKVESDIIFKMEKRLYSSQDRLAFLSDFAQFSPAEIRLNANVFMWHGRMPAIFEEHKLIVSEKRTQYEDALKVVTFTYEPPRDRINRMTVHPAKTDQPGLSAHLIRVFTVCSVGSYGPKLSSYGQRRLISLGGCPG